MITILFIADSMNTILFTADSIECNACFLRQ